jgi:hypothetical protein
VNRKAGCRGGCRPGGELSEIVVDHDGRHPFAEIVVAHVQPAGVIAELEAMPFMCPNEIVVDLPLRHFAALCISLVVPAKRGKKARWNCLRPTRSGRSGASGSSCWAERGLNTTCTGVELIDQIRSEEMRIAEHKSTLRLRGIGVEDWIDRVGVRSLQAGVLLKAIPDAVLLAEGVVDLDDDQILAVLVVQGLCTFVGTTRAVERVRCIPGSTTPFRPMGRRGRAWVCLRYRYKVRPSFDRRLPPAVVLAAPSH